MLFRLTAILLLFFILSCKQTPLQKETAIENSVANEIVTQPVTENFKAGKVIDPVTNNTNPSQSFAVYLPKNYSDSSKYPVVYFFDSHASGRLPLDKYYSLADEFNFILIGSDNSKNGMQPDVLMSIAGNLMTDVQKRLSINISRQYVAGFSGGARVAGMVAMQSPSIAGVIACSAGINTNNQNALPFAVVGIAGKEDFNMTELVALNKALDKTTVQHQLLLFEGKHEWCPLSTMRDAFLFLETTAFRNKTASVNNRLITSFKSATEKEAKKMQTANRLAEAAYDYEKLIHYLDGIEDTKSYRQTLLLIQQNKSYQNELSMQEQLIAQENQLREHYLKAFGKDIGWWKTEVGKINDEIKRQGNSEASFMLKRMLGSLSLASYMQANSAINANELEKANYILEIYKLVDPSNNEAWYLSAEVHAKQNNTSLSLQELQKAIDNGFKDNNRMMEDPAFASLSNAQEFISLLSTIKK